MVIVALAISDPTVNNVLLFVIFANFILQVVLSAEFLTIHENGLLETEKDHVIASALLAIEKSTNKNTIADSIVTEMVSKFGGNWYSAVTSNTTADSGTAIKLQSNQLIRFSYETYVILVFKLAADTATTNSTRTHVLAKINAARVATAVLVESDGINNYTHVNLLMNMTTTLFKSSTTNFDTNVCLSYAESSVLHIWDNSNCYYRLSITIMSSLYQSYNVTDVTIGETNAFSNYNLIDSQHKLFGFTLGPLFFLIHEY